MQIELNLMNIACNIKLYMGLGSFIERIVFQLKNFVGCVAVKFL